MNESHLKLSSTDVIALTTFHCAQSYLIHTCLSSAPSHMCRNAAEQRVGGSWTLSSSHWHVGLSRWRMENTGSGCQRWLIRVWEVHVGLCQEWTLLLLSKMLLLLSKVLVLMLLLLSKMLLLLLLSELQVGKRSCQDLHQTHVIDVLLSRQKENV